MKIQATAPKESRTPVGQHVVLLALLFWIGARSILSHSSCAPQMHPMQALTINHQPKHVYKLSMPSPTSMY